MTAADVPLAIEVTGNFTAGDPVPTERLGHDLYSAVVNVARFSGAHVAVTSHHPHRRQPWGIEEADLMSASGGGGAATARMQLSANSDDWTAGSLTSVMAVFVEALAFLGPFDPATYTVTCPKGLPAPSWPDLWACAQWHRSACPDPPVAVVTTVDTAEPATQIMEHEGAAYLRELGADGVRVLGDGLAFSIPGFTPRSAGIALSILGAIASESIPASQLSITRTDAPPGGDA